jgi:transglutaminase-like putative cysteine protease
MSTDVRRLIAFCALAAFASYHWFLVVDGSEPWRWIACVGIGAAGAVALLMLRGRRRSIVIGGTAVVFFAMFIGGLLAIGIPLASLVPGGGEDLPAQLSRGLAGVSELDTPYDGPDPWTRLGILAAVPMAVSLATLAAFWPAGEGRAGRAVGLGVLILLYGISVTWEAPSAELARGAALFAFVAAVLWLPRLPLPRAGAAIATTLLALAVAFPLASRVDASDPIISYTEWSVFGSEERITFNWNHTYGALDWPQEGTEVFVATTDRPLYWKTYVLDEFAGHGWTRANDSFGETSAEYYLAGATAEDVEAHPEWIREFQIELSGLRSRYAVTSGAPRAIEGIDIEELAGDGTVTAERFEIPSGSRYDLTAYVPDPTASQLRQAEGVHPFGTERYTSLSIPQNLSAVERNIGLPPLEHAVVPPRGVSQLPNERRFKETRLPIGSAVEGTPYERVLRLTRRIVAGARTDFAAVSRIQAFLAANYAYDQDVPLSEDPIPAFLFSDRAGYCQQFAGAMAMMLRMSGIPARVVSGFAPGVPQAGGSYSVSDTDAHAWVEVLYPGIGWVTVDPTPGQTPAHTDVSVPGSIGTTNALDRALGRAFANRKDPGQGLRGAQQGPNRTQDDGGSPVPLLAFLVLAGGGGGLVVRRRRRMGSPEGAELQLRELSDALRATGREPAPGATLLAVQSRLSRAVGPEAARYVAALRESRYGRRRRARPGPAERSAFRWALARRSGPLGWWKALRAIPLGGPRA